MERNRGRRVTARDPDLLLEAWEEECDLQEHGALKGQLSIRIPRHSLRCLREVLEEADVGYALTGFPVAWLYVRHAGYRLITLYLDAWPPRLLLEIRWEKAVEG